MYTPKHVAGALKISERYVYTLLRSGKIKSFRIGNRWRVTEEAIREYLRNSEPEEK